MTMTATATATTTATTMVSPYQWSVSSRSLTRNSANQWRFSIRVEGGSMHNLLLHLARMEIARRKDRREAGDLEIRLRASLPSPRTPSGCRRPPGLRKSSTSFAVATGITGEFLNSFSRTVCVRHLRYLCAYPPTGHVASPRESESPDGWRIFQFARAR